MGDYMVPYHELLALAGTSSEELVWQGCYNLSKHLNNDQNLIPRYNVNIST